MGEEKKVEKWNWQQRLMMVIIIFLVIIFLLSLPFFPVRFVAPESDSMSPIFNIGDAILLVKKEDIKVGDIICFKTEIGGNLKITHRVIEIKADGELVTKGDANENQEMWPNGWKLTKENVIGTYSGFRIPVLGYLVAIFDITKASLVDTESATISMSADQWPVTPPEPALGMLPLPDEMIQPKPSPTESMEPEPTESIEPTVPPEPTTSIEPEPTPSPTESVDPEPTISPEPSPTESIEPTVPPEPTTSIEPEPTPTTE